MINKIISGGQSGADLLAIDWAKNNNIPCEMNVEYMYSPLNNGIIQTDVPIHVVSNQKGKDGGWIDRRRYNILHSDFTLIFVKKNIYQTRGSLGTMRDCEYYDRLFSYITLSTVDSIDVGIVKRIFETYNVKILNIAGERSLNYNERHKMCKFLDMVILEYEIDNF